MRTAPRSSIKASEILRSAPPRQNNIEQKFNTQEHTPRNKRNGSSCGFDLDKTTLNKHLQNYSNHLSHHLMLLKNFQVCCIMTLVALWILPSKRYWSKIPPQIARFVQCHFVGQQLAKGSFCFSFRVKRNRFVLQWTKFVQCRYVAWRPTSRMFKSGRPMPRGELTSYL